MTYMSSGFGKIFVEVSNVREWTFGAFFVSTANDASDDFLTDTIFHSAHLSRPDDLSHGKMQTVRFRLKGQCHTEYLDAVVYDGGAVFDHMRHHVGFVQFLGFLPRLFFGC